MAIVAVIPDHAGGSMKFFDGDQPRHLANRRQLGGADNLGEVSRYLGVIEFTVQSGTFLQVQRIDRRAIVGLQTGQLSGKGNTRRIAIVLKTAMATAKIT